MQIPGPPRGMNGGSNFAIFLDFLKVIIPPLLAYFISRAQAKREQQKISTTNEEPIPEVMSMQARELLAKAYAQAARAETKAEDLQKELEAVRGGNRS